jgi:hypothetical protein
VRRSNKAKIIEAGGGSMPAVLPSLTAFDPETSGEGTLDPLGLYLIADQLATAIAQDCRTPAASPRLEPEGA